MTDRLKLSDPNGDAEPDRVAFMLEMKEHSARIQQLEKNIAVLEAEAKKTKNTSASVPAANNKIGARKDGAFKAISTAPSINKTPLGPSLVPIPYPTVQDLSSSINTARSVRFNNCPAYLLDASSQPRCKGDEPGTGKGIKSGTLSGEVKPLVGSCSVRIEGKRVVRDGDACTMNGGNNPGTYVTTPPPSGARPKEALASSNPARKSEDDTLLKQWIQQTKLNVQQAFKDPWEAIKGAGKGLANTPSHLGELLLKAAAEQKASELEQMATLQSILGQNNEAREIKDVALATRQQAEELDLPKLRMINAAQEGGDTISTLIQLALGGVGLFKTAAKGLAKSLPATKKISPNQKGSKIFGNAKSEDIGTNTGTAGQGVRVVKSSSSKDVDLAKFLETNWSKEEIEYGLLKKKKNPDLNRFLSDNEFLSIRCYTSGMYREINTALRANNGEKWSLMLDAANSGMTKLAEHGYQFKGLVRRDAKFSDAEIKKLFPKDGIYIDKTFTSSTKEIDGVFPGNTIIYIESSKGVDVSEISKFQTENEVLFKPETKFKITKKEFDSAIKKTVIRMTEIE